MTRPTIIAGVLALAAAIAPASSATVAEAQHAQAACGQTTVAGIKWKVTALGLPCSQGRTIALAFGQAHGPLLKKLGTTAAQTSSGRLRLSGMPSGTDWACYVSYPATRRPPGFFLCRDLKSIASNGGRTFDTVTFARVAVSTPPTTGGTSTTRASHRGRAGAVSRRDRRRGAADRLPDSRGGGPPRAAACARSRAEPRRSSCGVPRSCARG